jgi:hydrogenase large subunit
MEFVAAIDPVTRIEGHLKVEVKIDTVNGVQQVVDAWSVGTLFRGIETILINRDPRDSQHITERICGVCPIAHSLAAVLALDKAFNVTIPNNARVMRNLVHGANFVDSHILHFYLLALPDFIDGPGMPPWQPGWRRDRRLDDAQNAALVGHYVSAIDMHRKAQEMGSLFGGRVPHPPAFLPGGITTTPRSARIAQFKNYLNTLVPFIQDVYIPDVETIAAAYDDYYSVGRGPGNLLAYGVFDLDTAGNSKLLARGRSVGGSATVQTVDTSVIAEHVTYSWYADSTNNLNPASGATTPVYPKTNGYSWLKAPRYQGLPYETGPLARMWVNGDYRNGISVMDRHRARAYECLKVAQAMQTWINQISGTTVYASCSVPSSATSFGLTEAPRGALGHWLQIASKKISQYQVITPTCWNASPRDSSGVRGPLEEALVGTPIDNVDEPIEVLRVIHSYDPCLDCAVHVVRPAKGARVFTLSHIHGDENPHAHSHEEHEHADGEHHVL